MCKYYTLFICLFKIFGHTAWHVESQFPDQGSNPHPLQWKCEVLTTGPPGKSKRRWASSIFDIQGVLETTLTPSPAQQGPTILQTHPCNFQAERPNPFRLYTMVPFSQSFYLPFSKPILVLVFLQRDDTHQSKKVLWICTMVGLHFLLCFQHMI